VFALDRFRPLAALLALCACGGPEPKDVKKPTPPDMTALAAVYEAPSGVLSQETVTEAYDAARAIFDAVQALGIDQTLIVTVLEAVEAQQSGQTTTMGATGTERQALTEGEGYMLATRICNGWGPEPVPDTAHGAIRLTVGFTEAGIDPVVWGEVERCQYLVGASQVLLRGLAGADAGAAKVFFGEPVPFDAVAEARALFDFDVAGELDGGEIAADFDFRIDVAGETYEVRIGTSTGDLIAVVSGQAFTGVRAANGDFGCDEVTRSCTAGSETINF
jgi:hypothetical protein